MAGVEAAGFVLAAVPIVLQLLEQYKEGLDRTSVIFRRRKHVEKLGHALLMQRALLGANVESLLLACGVDGAADVVDDPFGVLLAGGVVEALQDHLGSQNYQAYSYAFSQCERHVREVTESLEGVGTNLGSGDLVAIIKANATSRKGTLDIGKRISFTLRKDGLDKAIHELDKSTLELERLQKIVSSNHVSAASSTSRRSNKSAGFLYRVKTIAEKLHEALQHNWLSGCHRRHDVRLLLEPRLDVDTTTPRHRRDFIAFNLLISSNQDHPASLWHAAIAESPLESEHDPDSRPTLSGATIPAQRVPRVSITSSIDYAMENSSTEVSDICVSIDSAAARGRILKFRVGVKRQLYGDHVVHGGIPCDPGTRITTLENLLTASNPQKMALKDRMILAVNLASNFLQLQNTSWLLNFWSKSSVQFNEIESDLRNTSRTSSTHIPPRSGRRTDTSRPFILGVFPGPNQPLHPPGVVGAKTALLEFGILLLEIWHETTFELRFPHAALATDYFSRLRFAWEWLEDINNPPPDLYSTAISQCVKCFFGGKPVSFDWDDLKFRRAICEDIIEPLHKNCKQWRT